MTTHSKIAIILAGAHLAALASPGIACAQGETAPPPGARGAGLPPPSAAQAPSSSARAAVGGDVIDLKNGGVLRGTLIDAIPHGQARIQLVTGEVATVPWPDIARIERASTPELTARLPASEGSSASSVWVHLEGSDVAQLQRDARGDRRHWDDVCKAPCDQAVSSQFAYRIVGDGIRPSKPFTVHAVTGDHETVTIDESSKGAFAGGIVGVSLGSFVMLVGLVVVVLNAAADVVDNAGGSSPANQGGEEIGWTLAGLGLAGLVGGIVLIATNAHSGVTQGAVSAQSAGLPSTGASREASSPVTFVSALSASADVRHDPAWLGALPRVSGVPLFTTHF